MRRYWQIGIGDGQVDMTEIFIKLQIALIGPGRHGDYFDNKTVYDQLDDGYFVRRFAEEVSIGDIFVLKHVVNPKKKIWHIAAVGIVVSPYRYEPIFDKVDELTWDVQHCRRVKWVSIDTEVQNGGAPGRFQEILSEENSLRTTANEILGLEN